MIFVISLTEVLPHQGYITFVTFCRLSKPDLLQPLLNFVLVVFKFPI